MSDLEAMRAEVAAFGPTNPTDVEALFAADNLEACADGRSGGHWTTSAAVIKTAILDRARLRNELADLRFKLRGIPDPEAFVLVADSLAKMVYEDFAEIGSPLDASVNVYRAARGTPRPSSGTEGAANG